ncbi:MAG: DnaJ domain-containing protein [Methylomonas sp.]|nr:DnaJ domain-containing protein [Methylomonas sp.]
MKSPYQILGVSEQASDAEIKQAYLQLVKDNPPDRDQQRFRQIQQAYEAIKDGDSRLRYALFHLPSLTFDELLEHAFPQNRVAHAMPAEDFLKLLTSVASDKLPFKTQVKAS